MRTLYYYETDHEMRDEIEYYQPNLTFDIKEAQQGTNLRVATMRDLHCSLGIYDFEEMFKGLFQVFNEETELPMIVTYYEDWDYTYGMREIVDLGYRQATPREIQSLSCDVCSIREECEDRVKIA